MQREAGFLADGEVERAWNEVVLLRVEGERATRPDDPGHMGASLPIGECREIMVTSTRPADQDIWDRVTVGRQYLDPRGKQDIAAGEGDGEGGPDRPKAPNACRRAAR